jgi:single-stranded DNA-binding protein
MLDVLLSGKLIKDPVIRTGASGRSFTTALVRCDTGEEESTLVSVIAFQEAGEKLGRLKSGDGVSIAGSAKLSSWVKDGETKYGLSVTASAVLSAYDVRKRRGGDEKKPAREEELNDAIPF